MLNQRVSLTGDYMLLAKLVFAFFATTLLCFTPGLAQENNSAIRQTIDFRVKDCGKKGFSLTSRVSVRKTFLTEQSTQSNRYHIYESHIAEIKNLKAKCRGQRIKGNNIVLFRPDRGSVFMSDAIVHAIFLPEDLKPGDVLEYEYTEEYTDIAYFPIISVPNDGRVDAFAVTIAHPDNVRIEFEFFFPRCEIKYEIRRPDPKTTTIRFGEVLEDKELAYHPFNDIHAAILVTLTRDGAPINPTTVQGLLDWYNAGTDLTPEVAERHAHMLDDELSGVTDDLDKLSVIHDWVRKNIRYVADVRRPHAYLPHDPSDVLDLKYGDCKDHAYLTSALARKIGLEVRPVRVHTEARPEFRGTHFAMSNHVICAWTCGDSTIFFDPTNPYYEFGNIPAGLIGKQALVLDSDHPRRETIGASNDYPIAELRLSADIDSLDKARATLVLRNSLFANIRSTVEHGTGSELNDTLHNICNKLFGPIRFRQFDYDSLINRGVHDEDITVIHADADLSPFVVSGQNRRYLPQAFMPAYQQKVFERESDSLPLYFEQPYRVVATLSLQAPGWDIDTGQAAIGDPDVVSYITRVRRLDHDTIQVSYDLSRQPVYLEKDDKAAFINFCKLYRDNNNQVYILNGRKQ